MHEAMLRAGWICYRRTGQQKGRWVMNLIAAADANWGIGSGNKLLVSIPDDMKFFRETTMGKVVVMGRRTFESFPGGALKGRVNFVLSHDGNYSAKDAAVAHSLGELRECLAQYDSTDVYVVGGESVYRQLLDECSTAYITKIAFAYSADAYFPDLDRLPEWKLTASGEEQTYFDLEYHFLKYERIQSGNAGLLHHGEEYGQCG